MKQLKDVKMAVKAGILIALIDIVGIYGFVGKSIPLQIVLVVMAVVYTYFFIVDITKTIKKAAKYAELLAN